MKKIFFSLVFLISAIYSYSQLIDNKVNISFGYYLNINHGSGTVKDGDFISPSLFSNFNHFTGLSLKAMTKINPFYSIGGRMDYLVASGWQYTNYNTYHNAEVYQYSFSPSLQFHSGFTEVGIYNRLKLIIELAPTIGLSDLKLQYPLFDIVGPDGTVTHPMNHRDLYFGLGSNLGFEASLTKSAGVYAFYSPQFNLIRSDLFNDKVFFSSRFCVGLVLRILPNKRFYY